MPQRLHNKKTPLTGRRKCGILSMSAAECRWPTIALPEMTRFYNSNATFFQVECTIALPEMTEFYNLNFSKLKISGNYSPAGNDRVL